MYKFKDKNSQNKNNLVSWYINFKRARWASIPRLPAVFNRI